MALDPEKLLTYQQHVRRLARALLRDQDLAEDVSQDAMAAALSRSGPPRSWRAWLSATVRNCAVSALRRESGREAREERAAAPLVIPSPEKIVQREDARRAVVNAVLALDPIYRTVLILRYFESLPPRRIAQELSLPVETVRTRIRRGLEMLRADLRGERGSNHALQVALIPLAGM